MGSISNGWTLTISTKAGASQPAPPTINTASFIAPGQFQLSGTGSANATYTVQKSSNLASWQTLGTATANGSGAFVFVDSTAAATVMRFYRVVYP